MILATLHGGPNDGLVLIVRSLSPLVFPMCAPVRLTDPAGDDQLIVPRITYAPELDTLRRCGCRPDCPNASCHFRLVGR